MSNRYKTIVEGMPRKYLTDEIIESAIAGTIIEDTLTNHKDISIKIIHLLNGKDILFDTMCECGNPSVKYGTIYNVNTTTEYRKVLGYFEIPYIEHQKPGPKTNNEDNTSKEEPETNMEEFLKKRKIPQELEKETQTKDKKK